MTYVLRQCGIRAVYEVNRRLKRQVWAFFPELLVWEEQEQEVPPV